MHVVVASRIHLPRGAGDEAFMNLFETRIRPLARTLENHKGARLAVRVTSPVWDFVDATRSDALQPLIEAGERVDWLGGGWSDPILSMFPKGDRERQLEREAEELTKRVGRPPQGAWPAADSWQPDLIETLEEASFDYALIPVEALAAAGNDPALLSRPRVADHLGKKITLLPIARVNRPNTLAEKLEELHKTDPDGCIALLSDDVEHLVDTVAQVTSLCLSTPSEYLGEHRPEGRVVLPDAWEGDWRRLVGNDRRVELLYRKTLRLSNRLGDRKAPLVADGLLAAQGHDAYGHGVYAEASKRSAAEALIAADTAYERGRQRGSSWSKVTRLDWDADGDEDLHVRTADLSAVIDPGEGRFAYLDVRNGNWPVTDVGGAAALMLCRYEPAADGLLPAVDEWSVEAIEDDRGHMFLTFSHDLGLLQLGFERNRLSATMTWKGVTPGRYGLALPVAAKPADSKVRVDGGDWLETVRPRLLAGHRFRFRHEPSDRQLLVTLPMPGHMAVLPNGADGLTLWPHWEVNGSGEYELTAEFV